MRITVHLPDDFAEQLAERGDISRRAVEALALEEFRAGRLAASALRQLLGFETQSELDGFLKAHGVPEDDPRRHIPSDKDRVEARRAVANIIARRKGVTLGGLKIKDLIEEGRS